MGDKPKAEKDAKKNLVHHSSDSEDSEGDLKCETCGVSFSDGHAYETHMQGKKHQKKVAEARLVAKSLAADKKSDDDDDDDDDDDADDMHCEVCDKSFTGYMSYLGHMKGGVHAKNVKKQKLEQKLGKMPDVLTKNGKDGGRDTDGDDDDILPKPYARCDACQKEFSGVESYNMHVRSEVHKKKMAMQNLKAKYHDEAPNSDGEEPFSKCDVCQKSFSGVLPYKVHMESSVHKRSLEKKKIAEEFKEFYVDDSGYVCKECKKCFVDPLAFKCHLQNNSHEKRKAKNALREFLNAHPEIVFVYPLADDDDDGDGGSGNESDADNTDSNYYLICKLCNVSFPGPESAQDHVKSKKHLNAKKQKKLQKLLKQQKENSEVKSTDGKSYKSSVKDTSKKDKPKKPENSPEHHADDFELI